MTIRPITDASAWNSFVVAQRPNTFLQSWQWGQIQTKDGESVGYLGVFDGDIQVAAALVVTVHARRGNFYLIPHGPITISQAAQVKVIEAIVAYVRLEARAEKAVCIRIAPLIEKSPYVNAALIQLGFRPSPLHIHAELTWVLDITPPLETILADMRKTARHAIKKGEPQVTVEIETSLKGLDRFWPLYEATKSRHQFVPFKYDFLKSQVTEFAKTNQVFIPIATYQGKDVAAAIMIQFGQTVFYYHGASIKVPGNIPAAHVLHWRAIEEAKKRGATAYNFWGIAPEDQPRHPFAGITVFKKGFGGHAIDYMHAHDLPLSAWYWKLWLVETVRKIKRGF